MNALVSGDAIAFWNARAGDWDSRVRADPFYEERERIVGELVSRHAAPSASVLEVGCATGTLAEQLLSRGFDAYGCDIAEEMIDAAVRRNGASHRFRVSSDGSIPFDRAFDAVIAVGVFPYVADHRRFAAHLHAHLAPGGVLVASSTNRMSLYTAVLLAKHLRRFAWSAEWRAVAANLLRTGVWSGGFTNGRAAQCRSARAFDAMMRESGLARIDAVDLFNIAALDRNVPARGAVARTCARIAAWTHIGVYRA